MGKGVGSGSQEAIPLGRQYTFRFFQKNFHRYVTPAWNFSGTHRNYRSSPYSNINGLIPL